MAEEPMVRPQSWETFQATGLLWWINRILHTFGWAIVLEVATLANQENGVVTKAYPELGGSPEPYSGGGASWKSI